MLLALGLAAAVLVVFLPAVHNQFINYYDDGVYVTANSHVQAGLNWHGLVWAFRSSEASNWHPLTWLSHTLDCQLFGLAAWGHHLTSILLHAINAALLAWLLFGLTGALWRSLFVAALFGVHPVHVESVAWVAERKDVLSTCFFLLTLMAYERYARSPYLLRGEPSRSRPPASTGFYVLALLFFALGLLCKPMLVTVPFVLLLLDYWPLRRARGSKSVSSALQIPVAAESPAVRKGSTVRVWALLTIEKAPFFLLAAASCLVTFLVQQHGGAVESFARLSISARLGNAFVSYARYVGHLLYPANLAIPYPHPGVWPVGTVLLCALLVVLASALALASCRRRPYLTIGWFWFLGTLVPVIGLVQVGFQSMADRYTYIPSIGIFIMVAWGAHALAGQWRVPASGLCVLAVAALTVCAGLTRRQLAYWHDSGTLFRHSLEAGEANPVAHEEVGNFLLSEDGKAAEAEVHFRRALELEPRLAEAYGGLGTALYVQGHRAEALQFLEHALALNPRFAAAHFNLGVVLQSAGRTEDAQRHFERALELKPDYAEAQNGLGGLLGAQGRFDEALPHLEEAIRLQPGNATTHFNLGLALLNKNRPNEAIHHFAEALRLRPNYPQATAQLRALRPAPGS